MSKVNKIFVVFLLIAGVLCLAIGTVFAVDFMAEHPEEFACDLKKPVVAANRPLVGPVVEPPLMDFVVPDSMVGTWYLDYSLFDSISIGSLNLYTVNDEPIISLVYEGQSYLSYSLMVDRVSSSPYISFALDIDQTDELTIETSVSFSVLHSDYGFVWYNSDGTGEVELTPSYVLDTLPDGFLTRVESPSGVEIVGSIVDILISGLTATGEAMGEAFSVLAESIFINADGTGLSTFGILVVVFAAVSLGLSLTRWVLNFCGSWGKRNR